MRLLLVTKAFPPHVGGMATWAYELGRQLAVRCADLVVVTARVPGSAEVDRGLPFEVLRIPCTAGTFVGMACAALATLCHRRRFDVLLGTQWESSVPGLIWRRRGGPPRIYAALRGREPSRPSPRSWPLPAALYAGTRERVIQQLDGWFALSACAPERLVAGGALARPALLLSGGCDAERFAPGPGAEKPARVLGLFGRPVLLSVGRLSSGKGVDTVLHALRRLSARHPELRYLICGDGPERPRLERLAEQLRVAHLVRFLGQVPADALPDVYRLCNIFVCAAHDDGDGGTSLGLAQLEASASGKPIVATHRSGRLDRVRNGHDGLLCQPRDAAALAGCIAQLLEDPELARRLGERGRQYVLQHGSWERLSQQLLAAMARQRSGERRSDGPGVSPQLAAE